MNVSYLFDNFVFMSLSSESAMGGMGYWVDPGLFGYSLFCTVLLYYVEMKTQ